MDNFTDKSQEKILFTKPLVDRILMECKERVDTLKSHGIMPTLAVILVGEDKASQIYINKKTKTCEIVGIKSITSQLPSNISEEELVSLIQSYNEDSNIHSILLQLPLPAHLDKDKIIMSISSQKDADGIHPHNLGLLVSNIRGITPCTPSGCLEILKYNNIPLQGTNVVIIGQSVLVGKPLALMLTREGATVTSCNLITQNLSVHTKEADIIISAAGVPNLIKKDMVKKGSVIIDVGINRLPSGKVVGDAEFEELLSVVSAITPVPGGVGPMTVAMLMKNTIDLASKHGL